MVVMGPRTFYICSHEFSHASIGCLAFSADGSPAGIFVTKQKKNAGDNGMGMLTSLMMGGASAGGSFPILRPIVDLLDIVTQAKARPQTAP